MRIIEDVFGNVNDPFTNKSVPIRRFKIMNNQRMNVSVITYGAIITEINVPDKEGKVDDICLGFDDITGYQAESNPYIGATIGRVCSRVGNGRFTLNGKEYEVGKNFFGRHALHGGILGFDKVNWEVERVRVDGVIMKFISPDGHEGYPGRLTATIAFTLTEDNCFRWCLEATTTAPTPVNMTNHAYFNLAGHAAGKKAMLDHIVMIKSDKFTEFDCETVPTGVITELQGHPLDLRKMKQVCEGLKPFLPKGYDHNYILELKNNSITYQAKAWHPGSGRFMDISSNQPCMHFYTSHNMPNVERGETPTIIGKNGAQYTKHGSFCMETSGYPDAVNHPHFPSVILNPGEKYNHVCQFRFGICKSNKTN